MRDIEIAVESRRGLVEQIGDRGRRFDIGDIAMHFLYAPTHSRFEDPGGPLLEMQSICAVDRNARRQLAEKGVGFPSPILFTVMIISPNAVRLELSARTFRQSVEAIIPLQQCSLTTGTSVRKRTYPESSTGAGDNCNRERNLRGWGCASERTAHMPSEGS
jgi:hypothetical protein